MRFLSIYKTFEQTAPPTPEQVAYMGKLIEEMMKGGTLLAMEGCLQSVMDARARISRGQLTVTDGPFTETKELIAGFALLQARSKAEAIERTKRLHSHLDGGSEWEIGQLDDPTESDCSSHWSVDSS
jgi:hypothetical protein